MDTSNQLTALLSDASIRRLAGHRYYQRGVDYFRRGLVTSLDESGDAVEAIVSGTEDYEVTFAVEGKRLDYSCSCPLGYDDEFCKHCVAAALAWLASHSGAPAPKKPSSSKRITTEDIATMLAAQDKDILIGWLMEWSQQDAVLRQRLTVLAALKTGKGAAVAEVRRQVEKAVKITRFRDYHEADAYAADASVAIQRIGTLIDGGHASDAIDLCEDAMQWLEVSVENIDDSNGEMTELMGQVADLHLLACERAKSDPEELGSRLFALQVKAGFSQWDDTSQRYAHLLGEPGLAAFRAAAASAWEKVPFRTAGHDDRAGERHYALTHIMMSLARESGDVEQLVAVLERDLTFANQYLLIAQAYREAGIHDKSLRWAERGMDTYTDYQGASLRLFVAESYRASERHADALRIVWSAFRNAPDLVSYKLLEDFARSADDWDDWRDRALAHVRKSIAEKPAADRIPNAVVHAWRDRNRASLLVEIFLHERRVEEAWSEAQASGCSEALWLELAAQREKTHPSDSAAIYLKYGEQAVAGVSNGRYESALQLLEKAAAIMHTMGKSQEFAAHLDSLRQRYKAKRNLQKLAESRRRHLYLQ